MGYMPRRHPKPSTQRAKCLSLVQRRRPHCYALTAAAWAARTPHPSSFPKSQVHVCLCRTAACTATHTAALWAARCRCWRSPTGSTSSCVRWATPRPIPTKSSQRSTR
eukprot:359490-Chlamydomonas_euryale.AAC.2